MDLYARFGIEYKDENFYIEGKYVGWVADILCGNKAATKHLLRNAEFRKLIEPCVAELADAGFMIFTMMEYTVSRIEMTFVSPYNDYIVGAIVMSDQITSARIIVNENYWILPEFIEHHPKHMNVLACMERFRAEVIHNIRAVLPQPIAEEIAAEFIMI